MKKVIFIILLCACSFYSQNEVLTNTDIIEMTRAGLSKDLIVEKVNSTVGQFDTSAKSLIELKKANVDDEIIKILLEKSKVSREKVIKESVQAQALQETERFADQRTAFAPSEALRNARTISIKKGSLYPTTQALEKELFKIPEWKDFNLTLVANQENTDLYIQISYVHLTWISRKYVYRIYDTQSGTVLAAGETTAWGGLSEHLAKNIVKSLQSVKTQTESNYKESK